MADDKPSAEQALTEDLNRFLAKLALLGPSPTKFAIDEVVDLARVCSRNCQAFASKYADCDPQTVEWVAEVFIPALDVGTDLLLVFRETADQVTKH